MIVIDYLSVLSKYESDQRLHGLSGVEIVLGGLWVVLKFEWNPLHLRTPPSKSAGILLFLSLISIFFFLVAILLLLLVLLLLQLLLLLLLWPLLYI